MRLSLNFRTFKTLLAVQSQYVIGKQKGRSEDCPFEKLDLDARQDSNLHHPRWPARQRWTLRGPKGSIRLSYERGEHGRESLNFQLIMNMK